MSCFIVTRCVLVDGCTSSVSKEAAFYLFMTEEDLGSMFLLTLIPISLTTWRHCAVNTLKSALPLPEIKRTEPVLQLRVTVMTFSFSCLYHNVIGASEVGRIEWAGLNCIVLSVAVLQHLHIDWPLWTDNCQTVKWRSEMTIIQLGFVIYLWTCRFNSHSANYRHHEGDSRTKHETKQAVKN